MQNTRYTTTVAHVIASYAADIKHAAYDSVAEASDYSITDNCYKIQFLLSESALHTNAHSLAVAALNCSADTVVRECMYDKLTKHA